MITPEQADFQDAMVSITKLHRPHLMDKISLADISVLWDKVEALYEEAEKREPIRRTR